eukprot:6454759-Amphidinium_carterae.1
MHRHKKKTATVTVIKYRIIPNKKKLSVINVVEIVKGQLLGQANDEIGPMRVSGILCLPRCLVEQ